jgi:hypothetical protein
MAGDEGEWILKLPCVPAPGLPGIDINSGGKVNTAAAAVAGPPSQPRESVLCLLQVLAVML